MDILSILKDIQFFNIYLQFYNQKDENYELLSKIRQYAKNVIYLDSDEEHKNFEDQYADQEKKMKKKNTFAKSIKTVVQRDNRHNSARKSSVTLKLNDWRNINIQ